MMNVCLNNFFSVQDLDIFPIDFEPLMMAIKKRVRLASEIDTLEFRSKKVVAFIYFYLFPFLF